MEAVSEYKTDIKYPIEVDWDNYKFRCSSLGELMPGPRAKEGQLQTTELSALQKIYLQEVWRVKEEVHTKEMDKGTIQESIGIDLMCQIAYPGEVIPKNTMRFSNDFITGEPDVIIHSRGIVRDIKCPWSMLTYMKSDLTKSYEWQLRGYMWLLGFEEAMLDYTLVDAPEEMILREQVYFLTGKGIFIYDWRNSEPEELRQDIDEVCLQNPQLSNQVNQIRHNMAFEYVPKINRLKSFQVLRDEELENAIAERALLWRSELKKMTL